MMPSIPPPSVLHPGPPPMHDNQLGINAGNDKDDKKDKGKRLGQACGACRKRKVSSHLSL